MIRLTGDNGLPSIEYFSNLFRPYRGKRAFIVEFVGPGQPPVGNNGDVLLDRVMRLMLAAAGVTVTRSPEAAELLLVRPGGALLDRFRAPSLLTRRLAVMPDLPLIVLPHSSWFEHMDPSEIFGRRKAGTIWVSRERESFDRLRRDWGTQLARVGIELELDHDLVITGRRHIPEVLAVTSRPASVVRDLLVARMGAEAADMRDAAPPHMPKLPLKGARRFIVRSLPAVVQHRLRRRTTEARQYEANEAVLGALAPKLARDFSVESHRSFDISDVSLCTFEQFASSILGAERVVSNRLHVSVPAALLGKQTWLVDSGYHKLRGVYEHSLSGLENLVFVPRTRR